MTKPALFFYHVTTADRAMRIIDDGFVDPKKSQGKNNVAWYVTRSKVTWAMAHVCRRHEAQIEDLAVMTCKAAAGAMLRTNRKGIYACAYSLTVIEMISASMWLSREEQYVAIPRGQRNRPRRTFGE